MKLKGVSRTFWIGAFIGSLVGCVGQGVIFGGAVRILFQDIIAILIFDRIGDVVAFVILGRLGSDDLGNRDTANVIRMFSLNRSVAR